MSEEQAVQEAMLQLIRGGLVSGAHDVSDGGLAVCLAEMAHYGQVGAEIRVKGRNDMRLDSILFGEAQSRIVFTVPASQVGGMNELVADRDVQVQEIGQVGGNVLRITLDGQQIVELQIDEITREYEGTIPRMMNP
jgi:phosphoribosylformylglycinamidine synthase